MAPAKTGRKAISEAIEQMPPSGEAIKELGEDLPEKDDVQKATKAAITAESPTAEVKEKVKVVKASPDAEDTPSGGAMVAVAGVSDSIERGEKYAREKAMRRWGYVTPDLEKA